MLSGHEMCEIVRKVVTGETPQRDTNEFFDVYDMYMEQKEPEVSEATMRKYLNVKLALLEVQKVKRIKLTFERINLDFQDKFKDYLLNHRVVKNKVGGGERVGLSNSTVAKYFENLKWFMTWAYDRGYHSTVVYRSFKTKRDPKEVIYLTPKELKQFAEVNLKGHPDLHKVRQLWMLQFYCGQRYSDMVALKYADLMKIPKGYVWKLYQIKGKKKVALHIPIIGRALEILNEFLVKGASPHRKVLPMLSNQKMNKNLKMVGKLAGINEMWKYMKYSGQKAIPDVGYKYQFLTTHVARKTFVTLSVKMGMHEEAVRGISGHTGRDTMKPYLGIDDDFIFDEYSKFWGGD